MIFYSFNLHNEMRSKMVLFLFIDRMMHRIKFKVLHYASNNFLCSLNGIINARTG